MILLDANLLIYAFDIGSPHHPSAREWLDSQLRGLASVGFPWESMTAFLRVVTNPRIYRQPSTMAAAWQQIANWVSGEPSWIPVATARHSEILRSKGEFKLIISDPVAGRCARLMHVS